MSLLIAGISGGKDSTAMVLRMAELGWDFDMLTTPTGNELPEVYVHMDRVVHATSKILRKVPAPTLHEMIEKYRALPNARMRWCTRAIKIEPCVAYLRRQVLDGKNPVLCIGLRADEPAREGLYDEMIAMRFPLREWGWTKRDVIDYCRARGFETPKRTDCMFCYAQRLREWWQLWFKHPDLYAEAEELEATVTRQRRDIAIEQGREPDPDKWYTFRSASRDTWPAALKDLRAEFEKGRLPRGVRDDQQETMFEDDDDYEGACRVCTL